MRETIEICIFVLGLFCLTDFVKQGVSLWPQNRLNASFLPKDSLPNKVGDDNFSQLEIMVKWKGKRKLIFSKFV